jgi:hypothetical protein
LRIGRDREVGALELDLCRDGAREAVARVIERRVGGTLEVADLEAAVGARSEQGVVGVRACGVRIRLERTSLRGALRRTMLVLGSVSFSEGSFSEA